MKFQNRRIGNWRRRRGVAMLETALALPLLLLVLFASLEFGLLFSRYQILLGITGQGARVASLFRVTCDPTVVEAEVTAVIESGSLIGMNLTDTTLTTITMTNLCLPGRFVTVQTIYRMPIEVFGPMMPMFGELAITEIPIRARVRMRNDTVGIP